MCDQGRFGDVRAEECRVVSDVWACRPGTGLSRYATLVNRLTKHSPDSLEAREVGLGFLSNL
jgi:hypothetical protein